jgi:hypothetical protein
MNEIIDDDFGLWVRQNEDPDKIIESIREIEDIAFDTLYHYEWDGEFEFNDCEWDHLIGMKYKNAWEKVDSTLIILQRRQKLKRIKL